MTAIQRVVSNIRSMRDPNPSLPALADRLEDEMAAYIPRHNDPDAIAQDADDRIRRHITVTTQELRGMVEEMRSRTEAFAKIAEDFIRQSEDGAAEIAAQVRAHTDKVSSKMAALKG